MGFDEINPYRLNKFDNIKPKLFIEIANGNEI